MRHILNAAWRISLAKLAFVVMAGTAYANQPYHFQAPLDDAASILPGFMISEGSRPAGTIVVQVSATSAQGQQTMPLASGTELVRGERYWSPSGAYFLTLNEDGNLVVARADGGYVWGLDTQPNVEFMRIARVVWQEDGNLAAYADDGSYVWSALTENPDPTALLMLQPDGALQIVAGTALMWSSAPGALQDDATVSDDDGTMEQPAADEPELAELQPPEEAGIGEVQVTLLWTTADDLDLYVTEPDGFVIYWDDVRSYVDGRLDIDNRGDEFCRAQEARAENVFWVEGAPHGTYTVETKNFIRFHECNQLVPAKIQVRVGGKLIIDQIISVGEDQPITFNVP